MAYLHPWGNSTCKSYLDKLVKLQKLAIRVVSNSHYRCHTEPLKSKFFTVTDMYSKSKFLTVTDMYSLKLGVFIYKFSTNKLPLSF